MPEVDTSKIVIDSTFSMAQSQTPSDEHSIFAFKIGADGRPERGSQGWYKIQTLLDSLGKIATDAESGAVSAKEAVEQMKTAIESTIAAFNEKVTTDNSQWDAKVAENLQSLADTLAAALKAIGESNSEGARGNAINAIQEALNSALSSIGQSDAEGARGNAITAIANKLTEVLQSLSDASTAANQVIDQKVSEATNQANAAASSAAEAQKWASEAQAAVNMPDVYGYAVTLGDGISTAFTIAHNLNTQSIIVQLWDSTGNGVPMWDMQIVDANSVKITFEDGAPASNGVSVCILPVRMRSGS